MSATADAQRLEEVKKRYKRFEASNAVLEEEMAIVYNALKRMEKAASNHEFSEVKEQYVKFRKEVLVMLSRVSKIKNAKVSFR